MRKNQWYVLGTAFLLLAMFFILQDLAAEEACGVAGTPPAQYTMEEWIEKGSEAVSRVGIWCINTEIFDPFIYIFIVMGIVCWINGWLEGKAEKK